MQMEGGLGSEKARDETAASAAGAAGEGEHGSHAGTDGTGTISVADADAGIAAAHDGDQAAASWVADIGILSADGLYDPLAVLTFPDFENPDAEAEAIATIIPAAGPTAAGHADTGASFNPFEPGDLPDGLAHAGPQGHWLPPTSPDAADPYEGYAPQILFTSDARPDLFPALADDSGKGNSDGGGSSGVTRLSGMGGEEDLGDGGPRNTLHGDTGHDTLPGDTSGGDTGPSGSSGDGGLGDTLHGDTGHDTLPGDTSGGDTGPSGTGDHGDSGDTLHGGGHNDGIHSGDGNDTLHGDSGHETHDGGSSNHGDSGHDTQHGDSDGHGVSGNSSDDGANGGTSGITRAGGSHDDNLSGGAGHDNLSGNAGDDTLYGGAGNDTLDGGAGDDRLFGGSGNDVLIGGAGKDYLSGGSSSDTLTGGAGKDTFALAGNRPGTDTDHIADFRVGKGGDILDLSGVLDMHHGDHIADFVHGWSDGANTHIDVSANGNGSWSEIAVLDNCNVDLGTLIANGQIVTG